MALVTPGTINITLGQRQPSVTAVQIGTQKLQDLTNVDMNLATDGSVIVYRAATQSFAVEPFSAFNLTLDNGFF